MRKLNVKNRILILIFVVIVVTIIGILFYSVRKSSNKSNVVYDVNSNTVVFASDSNLIDTTKGGVVEKNWNNEYKYVSSDKISYVLGNNPIIYDTVKEEVVVFGDVYQVFEDGSILKNVDHSDIELSSKSKFYKLADRVYLIVSDEIYNKDKTIYANKYLIVYVDKQGNASVLNDSINIKTINPMQLLFGNYTFDIALEKLIINDKSIDLKAVIGSTNEYVVREVKDNQIEYDEKEFVESYNKLVSDFNQYTKDTNVVISSNNQLSNNQIVINGSSSDNKGDAATNKVNLTKRVSLRGTVSNVSYIDVSYIITDPEDKYQGVYLLVTGNINNVETTQKIMLDKYQTSYRIVNLQPNSEYTIGLGYIEVVGDDNKNNQLFDNIEDIINVRTEKINYELKIEKISGGYVYFNYKMPSGYAFEQANIVLYVDNEKKDVVVINYNDMISEKGFSGKLLLDFGNIYELRLENIIYNDKEENYDISKKFVF